jgi:thiol-disulfide isomerase/thioredoxin
MKKYIPIVIPILLFTTYLTVQFMLSTNRSTANPSDVKKKTMMHYSSVLKSSQFKTLKGEKVSFKNIKAEIVIVNFWASWCTPCLEEFPSLVKLAAKYPKDKVLILGINSDEDEQLKAIKRIKKKYKINFDIVLDRSGRHTKDFMISAIPVSIIFHKGKVIEVSQGAKDFFSAETLEKFEELLNIKS